MIELSQILGHDRYVTKIKHFVSEAGVNYVKLSGPSGSGKTWILDYLTNSLIENGFNVLSLSGNSSRKNEPYYPLSIFIEKRTKIKKTGKEVFFSALGEIPFVGKPIKTLIEGVDTRQLFSGRKLEDIPALRRHVSFSLHLLGLLKNNNKTAIVCDNLSDFDSSTISYLNGLEDGLKSIVTNPSLSIICSTGLSLESLPTIEMFLRPHIEVALTLPAKTDLSKILNEFGVTRKLNSTEIDLLYSCTGGNLYIIRSIANHLNRFPISDLSVSLDSEVVENLIDYRLHLPGTQHEKLKDLLYILANVGSQASRNEIVCLSNNDKEVFDILGIAESMDFIRLKDNYIQFSHEVIKRAFEKRSIYQKLEVSARLSDCLRKISPSNYVRRALLERSVGNEEQADILWSIVAIGKLRGGLNNEAFEVIENIRSPLSSELKSAFKIFVECYKFGFEGKVKETLDKISEISNSIPLLLQAEKACIECEHLSKRIDLTAKELILNRVEGWHSLKDEEPEIWYRLMQMKIVAARELNRLDIAKQTELEIVNFYSKRIAFDLDASFILNRLDIYAELIYAPEIAHLKMTKVEQRLSIDLNEERFDRIIDLYISRINLSSNSLLLGKYEFAAATATKALDLAKEFSNIRFPCPEVALTNLYLSGFMSEALTPVELCSRFEHLANDFGNEEDCLLLKTNYAGILLSAGLTERSYNTLIEYNEAQFGSKVDPYYYYYYYINLRIIEYIRGDYKTARDGIIALEAYVSQVVSTLDRYYKKHYDILREVLEVQEGLNYDELCSIFENKHPEFISPIWNKFKKVYLFSDLQIWTSF